MPSGGPKIPAEFAKRCAPKLQVVKEGGVRVRA